MTRTSIEEWIWITASLGAMIAALCGLRVIPTMLAWAFVMRVGLSAIGRRGD